MPARINVTSDISLHT